MGKVLALIFIFGLGKICASQVNSNYVPVKGHYRNNTWIESHYRTSPNFTINDNYSTHPNVNPWTGKAGTIDPETPMIPFLDPVGTTVPGLINIHSAGTTYIPNLVPDADQAGRERKQGNLTEPFKADLKEIISSDEPEPEIPVLRPVEYTVDPIPLYNRNPDGGYTAKYETYNRDGTGNVSEDSQLPAYIVTAGIVVCMIILFLVKTKF